MKKISNFGFIIFFILVLNILNEKEQEEEDDPGYENLLEWGIDNSLIISDKIKFIKRKDTKKYIAQDYIHEKEIIMDIPPACMINLNKSFEFFKSKTIKKAFKQYKKESSNKMANLFYNYHEELTFMIYILYMVNNMEKKYEKNKFYQYYKPIFYMIENNLDSFPYLYSNEQISFFKNTSFEGILESMKNNINSDIDFFEDNIYKKIILLEDYLIYYIFAAQNSYLIDGKENIVPYINFIKRDFKNINCEYSIENGNIIIKAIKTIFPGEDLIIKPKSTSNHQSLFYYGETYEELLDIFQNYTIPILNPSLFSNKYRIKNLEGKKIDIINDDFYKNMINIYKEFAKYIKEDDSELGACNLILKYIKKLKEDISTFNYGDIKKAFFKKKDADNVMMILNGEKRFLQKKIDSLEKYIKRLKKKPIKDEEEKVNEL